MKSSLWLFLAIGILCLVAARRRASAENAGRWLLTRVQLQLHVFSPGDRAADQSSLLHSDLRSFDQDPLAEVDPLSEDDAPPPLLRASDLQPDDDGLADDDLFQKHRTGLARSGLSDTPGEWRLRTRDAQQANSFIHSKAKPPPQDHHHNE